MQCTVRNGVNMIKEFKAGDKVYYPKESNKVFTLGDNGRTVTYHLRCYGDSFARDGRGHAQDIAPSLFHATPENHASLEQLYGIEFEKPPIKPTSLEIIQAMLVHGDKFVPCWVSNVHKHPAYVNKWTFICEVGGDYYLDEEGTKWGYATPFDHKTEQAITELPE